MTQLDPQHDRHVSPPTVGRVPPNAIEMEESLIGAMLLSPEAVSIAYETVEPEDFYRPLHAQIFSAILALANAGEPVDYVTVQAKLQEQGAAAVECFERRRHQCADWGEEDGRIQRLRWRVGRVAGAGNPRDCPRDRTGHRPGRPARAGCSAAVAPAGLAREGFHPR